MGKAEILELIEASGLAASVKEYCAGIIRSALSSSLKDALKADAAKVIENIDMLLTAGGDILGCSKEEVLFTTGFNKNNMAPERFESALAELRAVNFLHNEGFGGLELIGSGPKKSADISGIKDGRKYVFEVCCITRSNDLASVDHLFDGLGAATATSKKKPVDYLELKYDEKIVQVNSSRKEYGCERGGIFFVINAYNFVPFMDDKDLKELAGELHARKNKSRLVHVCLICGGSVAVFPDW